MKCETRGARGRAVIHSGVRFTVAFALGGVALVKGNLARADEPLAGGAYTLDATVSPPPLTLAECQADARCIVAPLPQSGSGADDHTAIAQAVTAAQALAVDAVISNGAVVTAPQTATVLLRGGTYSVTRPVLVPPNVNIRGVGIRETTVLLRPDSHANFGYSYLFMPSMSSAGSQNLISDLTVNGSCRVGAGTPWSPHVTTEYTCNGGARENHGGGIMAGDRWTVRQVRFTNFRYFGLWIRATRGVTAVDNRFDNRGGAYSGGNDNIGGGGGAEDTLVSHNQFDETIVGNSLDLNIATRVTIRRNTVRSNPAYVAARNVPDYGSMYLEAVTSSLVEENVFHGAHLAVQSNAGYGRDGENLNVINARDVTIARNRFFDSLWDGLTLRYDHDASSTPHQMFPGGGNIVMDNEIIRARLAGMRIFGTKADAKSSPDVIRGNTIVNAGFGGTVSTGSTGCAAFDMAGIALGIGQGDQIYENAIVDDQLVPTTWYGIHVGARGCSFGPTTTILTSPAGVPNSGVGLIAGLVRYGAAAPQPVTTLSAARSGSAAVLSWNEPYAMSATPVAGYRVYRNGVWVATIPGASPVIPGNLLSDAQSSFETGIAGWSGWPEGPLSAHTGDGLVGGASLALTSASGSAMPVWGPSVAVNPGATYTSVVSFRSTGATRPVRAGIAWRTASAASIGTWATNNRATHDTNSEWITSAYTMVAPANAAYAQVFAIVDASVTGEKHLIDRAGLVAGTMTETWTDAAAPPGQVAYHVVAYRSGDGENSTPKAVVVQ